MVFILQMEKVRYKKIKQRPKATRACVLNQKDILPLISLRKEGRLGQLMAGKELH